MTCVKICGLTRMEDVEAVNRFRPEYAGFVFAQSRRRLTMGQAKPLVAALNASVLPVGVFADETEEFVAAIAQYCGLKAVQLHGSENGAYVQRLRNYLPGVQVIKAVRVKDKASLAAAEQAEGDLLLLDAWHETALGGAGEAFDWSLLEDFGQPYFLAGGLNPGNVAQAVLRLKPYGVDVSSGVETDGIKDAAKIEQFITQTRSIWICAKGDTGSSAGSTCRKR